MLERPEGLSESGDWLYVMEIIYDRKTYNLFYNQPQGTRIRRGSKNRWMGCAFSDIKNAKLGTGRSSQGIEGYGGDPLWRRRSALGCSDNEEEE